MLNTCHSYAFIGVANASTAGVAMSNIASTLGKVGRRTDALELFEKAMEFRIHVLPGDHPEIGEFDSQLLSSFIVIMTSLWLQGMPCSTSPSHSASFIGTQMLWSIGKRFWSFGGGCYPKITPTSVIPISIFIVFAVSRHHARR
jgi:hypothetical protein